MDNMNRPLCSVRETELSGIKTVYVENEQLKAGILAGKGADVYELHYKPKDMDLLLKTSAGLDGFKDRDLSRQRLKMYSEVYYGGWQDCLPHRARYEDRVVEQDTGGIAATLPWHVDSKVTDEGREAVVRCTVQLPVVPLHIEKTFTLRSGEAALHVEARLRNAGSSDAVFTWTQHPAFGGRFLDEQVSLELPECTAFHPRLYRSDPGKGMAAFEEPVGRITLHGGAPRDIREVLPRGRNEELFLVLKNVREPWARLVNRRKGVGVRLRWELDAFPYIRYWSSIGPDRYTIAVEPSNDAFASLDDSLEHGTFRTLRPGEEYATAFVCDVFETERN